MQSKIPAKCFGVVVLATMTAAAHAEAPAMRDATTEEQLVLNWRKAAQTDPMKNMTLVKGEDPSVKNRPQDLLSQSDILCFEGIATLVPKHAIMQVPETCAQRLKIQPEAKIVGWADFYAANRGWITTIEISREQAEGKEPIAEDTRKMMTQCRNLIVATYMGGPISLLPPKVPPPGKTPPAATPTEITQP